MSPGAGLRPSPPPLFCQGPVGRQGAALAGCECGLRRLLVLQRALCRRCAYGVRRHRGGGAVLQ